MKIKLLVLDTSVFVNPDSAHFFGSSPTKAFARFLELIADVEDVQFMMPPSIYQELMHFVEEQKIPPKLLLKIHKKPPQKHELKVPGIFVYTLVDHMRDRIDRGLRLAERHVREALNMDPPSEEKLKNRKEIRPDAEAVGRLRENYRRIMREGLLDSSADVDLLLLAYETGATLVSADQGVLDWAGELGVSTISHAHLRDFLTENLQK